MSHALGIHELGPQVINHIQDLKKVGIVSAAPNMNVKSDRISFFRTPVLSLFSAP